MNQGNVTGFSSGPCGTSMRWESIRLCQAIRLSSLLGASGIIWDPNLKAETHLAREQSWRLFFKASALKNVSGTVAAQALAARFEIFRDRHVVDKSERCFLLHGDWG